MRWAKKWWWLIPLILAVTLIVGWEEKRGQTQAYQCRASYAAQSQSERLSGASISVYQQAAEQQAIAAACEPNGYFYRLFGAANLPTMLLVFFGIGATWAALRTLKAIEKQSDALINSERAWVLVGRVGNPPEGWRFGSIPGFIPGITLEFRTYGNTPIKLKEAKFILEPLPVRRIGIPPMPALRETPPDYSRTSLNTDLPAEMTIPPGAPFQLRIGRPTNEVEMGDLNAVRTVLCAYGFISYEDTFGKARETRVCFVYYFQPSGGVLRSPDGALLNPEGFMAGGPRGYNDAT